MKGCYSLKKVTYGRSKKTGLPPGTLIHIGEKKAESIRMTQFKYNETDFEEIEFENPNENLILKDNKYLNWVNVIGIHDAELLGKIGELYGLHPLVMEDILSTEQRPKVEDYSDYTFIVAKMLYFDKTGKDLVVEQVSLILGEGYVISFQENGENIFHPIRERLKNGVGRIRKSGSDYLIYSLLDSIVDNYFNVLEKIGEIIEFAEDALLLHATNKTLQQIHQLKREMLFIHKSIWPLREVLGALERGESKFIQQSTVVYLRDVYDHIIQTIDTTETYRDILSGMLDIYLSSASNKMNEVMKILTVFSTIFMPITFIVGVYGMNFKIMPELEWVWGYPAVWLLMITISISMLIFFKRKKWI